MKAFGLTGNIGCGKSTVAALLSGHPDILVIDCDRIAKKIISGGMYRRDINAILGVEAFPNGEVDTRIIAKTIFNDPAKLTAFEALIHPLVWTAVEELTEKSSTGHGGRICVVESAIIYETGSEDKFTAIIVATCKRDEQLRRLRENRKMSEFDIQARFGQQMPLQEKEAHADIVIHTDCNIQELRNRVQDLYHKLKGMKVQ